MRFISTEEQLGDAYREADDSSDPVQFADHPSGKDSANAEHDRFINTAQSAISDLISRTRGEIDDALKKNDLTDRSIFPALQQIIAALFANVRRAMGESLIAAGLLGMAAVAAKLSQSGSSPRKKEAQEGFDGAPTVTLPPPPSSDQGDFAAPPAAEAALPPLPPGVNPPVSPPSPPGDSDAIFPDAEPPIVRFPELDSAVTRLRRAELFTSDDYLEVAREAQQGAFAVTGELQEETLNDMRLILARNLQEGADAEALVRDVNDLLGEGTGLSEARLHQIFRNNMQTTISDSMERTLHKPLVVDFFQYRAYFSTSDERARDTHRALEKLGLNGTNIYNKDDPVWQEFRAPWDYNCRCSWAPVTVRDAARRGVAEAQAWWERAEAIAAKRGGRPANYLAETAPQAFEFVPHPPFSAPPEFKRR